jgi:hypothetical protein
MVVSVPPVGEPKPTPSIEVVYASPESPVTTPRDQSEPSRNARLPIRSDVHELSTDSAPRPSKYLAAPVADLGPNSARLAQISSLEQHNRHRYQHDGQAGKDCPVAPIHPVFQRVGVEVVAER